MSTGTIGLIAGIGGGVVLLAIVFGCIFIVRRKSRAADRRNGGVDFDGEWWGDWSRRGRNEAQGGRDEMREVEEQLRENAA